MDSVKSPMHAQMLMGTLLLISATASAIFSVSLSVGPRPLLTRQKRMAPASLALTAACTNSSLARNGYLSISASETADCEQ